jgi:microcystin degradation protein MlrC
MNRGLKMANLAQLSQSETVELIRASSRDAVLPLRFGGNRVYLDLDTAGVPILRRLAELRGLVTGHVS